MDNFLALVQELRGMSDAEVRRALENSMKNLDRLQPYTSSYTTCRRVVETVKAQFELRKANAGVADLDWEWLLSSILGAYSFEPAIALAAALKPYGFSVPNPPAFYDYSGQAVIQIQMAHNDAGQLERILQGFKVLKPFLAQGRRGYPFSLKTSKVKSRAKSGLTVEECGATTVSIANEEFRYPSLRAALEQVAREFYWEEPPVAAPKSSRTQRTRGKKLYRYAAVP